MIRSLFIFLGKHYQLGTVTHNSYYNDTSNLDIPVRIITLPENKDADDLSEKKL